MITFIIKNSYLGILSAVFFAYENKVFPNDISTEKHQLSFTEKVYEIPKNTMQSARVDSKLKEILYPSNYTKLKNAIRSNYVNKHLIIFNYIVKTINAKKDIYNNFAVKEIFDYYTMVSAIKLEVHRLLGFIRFEKTENGIYYAHFTPDCDVCELILPHFIRRFKSIPFILHDTKHNVIIGYNNGEYKVVKEKIPQMKIVGDETPKFFKRYCQTVFIKERKNLRCMNNFLPRRYQKFMPEKNELL